MENNTPKYWKGLDELHREEEFEKQRYNEFAEKLPLGKVLNESEMGMTASRRDFLKFMGFSISAATLAACHKTPVKKVIPYVVKPEAATPGLANYYATTCSGCQANCGLVVKTREGRPIKIDGNTESPIARGGSCAVGQATVLSLYDSGRLAGPRKDQKEITWADLDKEVISQLTKIASSGGQVRILTGTINSPSTLNLIKEFTAKYPNVQHIPYDAVSSYALLAAHGQAFGRTVVPNYKIETAKVIVSFGADFLGTWISPVEYTKQYVAARKVDEGQRDILHHIQFETTLTTTGSNADMRAVLSPSQYGKALVKLHNLVAAGTGGAAVSGDGNFELMGNSLKAAADKLLKNRGRGIVITDSNNIDHQLLVASINSMLGNYGSTIDLDNPSYQRTGNDKEVIKLVNDMNAGTIGAIIVGSDINPAYTYPDKVKFAEGFKKVGLRISLADRMNETAELAQYVAPDSHFLESWGDAQPKEGVLSLYQPTISPIFRTRQIQDSLLTWMGNSTDYHTYLQNFWQTNFHGRSGEASSFGDFWVRTLEKGVLNLPAKAATAVAFAGDVAGAASRAGAEGQGIEVVLYQKVAIRDGKEANNPWLQETPDPVSKITWDNYALISPKLAEEKGLKDEDVIDVTIAGKKISVPVVRQPGQRMNTIAIAVGYGRKVKNETAARVVNEVGGVDVYPFVTISGDTFQYMGQSATIATTGTTYPLAATQTHHHMEGRDLVRETTVAQMAMGNYGQPKNAGHHSISLYKDYRFPGHHWAMVIDTSACTGCNACVVSCNAENNVPVVGKAEVRRRREMHWLRIDRYYSIADDKGTFHNQYKEIDANAEAKKNNYENIQVVFQPMLCQHCENAPCENVCPVNAISHSSEGHNQQIYNRCVGTRYCANNCPYKVRRFNWFTYTQNDEFDYNLNNPLGRMVLNPDITVRMRGVMEKCTLCVHRTQLAKLEAKKEGRPLKDGEVKTACQQTCPANAIVFGDQNDPNSEVSKLLKNKRTYTILDELNTRPIVSYMSTVRSDVTKA